jgi:protein-S-isoprenylcysteine O-methyltransferase Ste14
VLTAHHYLKRGVPWQIFMIVTFLYRRSLFPPTHHPVIVLVLLLAGLTLFGYCLYVLYVGRKAGKRLETTGVFKYTRHPMYTALVLLDSSAFFGTYSLLLLLSTILFYTTFVVAAYYQEQETLARFGKEAEAYYQRTPRLFFMYPFLRRK